MPNKLNVVNELHKAIIRKFKKSRVYSLLKGNIWGVDWADVELISKCNEGVKCLLCAIDIFS